jgi:hypothetical protein
MASTLEPLNPGILAASMEHGEALQSTGERRVEKSGHASYTDLIDFPVMSTQISKPKKMA